MTHDFKEALELVDMGFVSFPSSTEEGAKALGKTIRAALELAIALQPKPISEAPMDRLYLGVICGEHVCYEPFMCEFDEDEGHICQFKTESDYHRPTHFYDLSALPKVTK